MPQQEEISEHKYDLLLKLCAIDNGRFEDIVHVFKVDNTCGKCDYFNLAIKDKTKGYRCYCLGSCISATLHPNVISYINWKLGWITQEQHQVGCGI